MTRDLVMSNISNCGTSSNVLISGATEHASSTSVLNVRTDYHSVGIHENANDVHRLSVNGSIKSGNVHSKKITLRYDEEAKEVSTIDIDVNYGMIIDAPRMLSDYNLLIKEGAINLLRLSSAYLAINCDLKIAKANGKIVYNKSGGGTYNYNLPEADGTIALTTDIPTSKTLANVTDCGTSGNVLISGAESKGASTNIINVDTTNSSVGINILAPATIYKLDVNGKIHCNGIIINGEAIIVDSNALRSQNLATPENYIQIRVV